MMKSLLLFVCLFLLAACGAMLAPMAAPTEDADCSYCVIQSAHIDGDYTPIPFMGDIWTTTWAADGTVYAAFGDATGMSSCLPTLFLDRQDEFDTSYTEVAPGRYIVADENNEYCEVFGCEHPLPLCQYTPAGLLTLLGEPPTFTRCEGPDQCVVSRHIPYGNHDVFYHSDKPSSILAVDKRIYMPMHYPPGNADHGYIAYSNDMGRSWQQVPDSPWKNGSPFQVLMFFNMGKNYSQNSDRYVYGLGITDELPDGAAQQDIYLARVPLPDGKSHDDPVLRYDAYEYFVGLNNDGTPRWSSNPASAAPLDGLKTIAQGAAFYHAGAGQYLFLTGFLEEDGRGALFAAPNPWGPWYKVNDLPAGFIAGVITKGATTDSFYFTAAGGGPVTYNLNVGQIKLTLDRNRQPPPLTVVSTQKVEQIVGDVDLETMQPTRQQTASRFNVLFTDLGSPFEFKNRLWFLFGDTDPESPGWDERHDDAIAWTNASRAADLRLNFLTDPTSGRGILNPRIDCPTENKPDCIDLGTLNVPVAGLGDNDTLFVWFTADGAGRSLLARSDDNGRHFRKVFDFGASHFIDIAVQRYEGNIPGLPGHGPWALIFGSGDHEHNDVYLATIPIQDLRNGDKTALRFLSGINDDETGAAQLTWSTTEADAVTLFNIEHGRGPGVMSEVPHGWGFGEPLVQYDQKLDLWLATYNAARKTIRLRTAKVPWGPWSTSVVLFDPATDYGNGPAYGRYIGDGQTERLGGQGELYGPYLIPRFTELLDDGRIRLYWLLSPWQPYVVYLMQSTLIRQ